MGRFLIAVRYLLSASALVLEIIKADRRQFIDSHLWKATAWPAAEKILHIERPTSSRVTLSLKADKVPILVPNDRSGPDTVMPVHRASLSEMFETAFRRQASLTDSDSLGLYSSTNC